MARYEYRILPAPRRGNRVKGLKSTEDRFAATLTEVMNAEGRDGWEYIRSDILPVEERQGLTGHTTAWQTFLVFRRALPGAEAAAPALTQTPDRTAEAVVSTSQVTADPSAQVPLTPAPSGQTPPTSPAPPLRATTEPPPHSAAPPVVPKRDKLD